MEQNLQNLNLNEQKQNEQKKKYVCPVCGKEFKRKQGYIYHITHVHPIKPEQEQIQNEQKTEQKQNEQEQKIEQGIQEEKIDYSKTDELKQKLLEMTKEEEETKEEIPEETEEKISKVVSEIEFDAQDFGELYLSIFSLLGQLMGVDLYNDPVFIARIEKRGRLLQKLFAKYGVSEDFTVIAMLISSVLTDMMYLFSKRKEVKKQKEKEEKEKKEIEKIVNSTKPIEGIVQEGATA